MATLEEIKATYKIQNLRGTDKYRVMLPNGEFYVSPIVYLFGLSNDYTPVTLERARVIIDDLAFREFSDEERNWENVND